MSVFIHSWKDMLQGSVLVLGLLGALLRLRVLHLRRESDGSPILSHTPGTLLVVFALLHDGPAAAMAVNLLSGIFPPWRVRRGRSLPTDSRYDPFFIAMTVWLTGCLYFFLGGHRVHTAAESGQVFQNPCAVILPLLGATALVYHGLLRCVHSFKVYLEEGASPRIGFFKTRLSLFHYAEMFNGIMAVTLWSTWGWTTLPFVAVIYAVMLQAATSYFAHQAAKREAEHDSLTGLASWRKMQEELQWRVDAKKRKTDLFALGFLDVDGVKTVNDTFGHAVGDELLCLVGEICRMHMRERDLVCRRSGDEFLVILDGLDQPDAERVFARLRESIEDSVAVHSLFAGVTGVSAGLAFYPTDARDADSLLELADHRMYAHKRRRKSEQRVDIELFSAAAS